MRAYKIDKKLRKPITDETRMKQSIARLERSKRMKEREELYAKQKLSVNNYGTLNAHIILGTLNAAR